MRVTPLVPLLLVALATCKPVAPPPTKGPTDLTIDIVLALDHNRCVVRFADTSFKSEQKAVAWTKHAVVWRVTANACGEKKKSTLKALGLKHFKLRNNGTAPAWLASRCSTLSFVPDSIGEPPQFRCDIPSIDDQETPPEPGIYDYAIDGDSVEPADPGLDLRRNG
jgi:hypothetical protein